MTKVEVTILQQRIVGSNLNIEAEIAIGGKVTRKSYTVDKSLNNDAIKTHIIDKLKEEKKNENDSSKITKFEAEI